MFGFPGEEFRVMFRHHAPAGTAGRDDIIAIGEGVDVARGDVARRGAIAGIVGRLAAAGLRGHDLQMIWKMHPKRQVTFQLINRTTSVNIADFVDERELTDQLDHARTLRLAKNELIWLAGNTFPGTHRRYSSPRSSNG